MITSADLFFVFVVCWIVAGYAIAYFMGKHAGRSQMRRNRRMVIRRQSFPHQEDEDL